jgi:transposase-like protein
MARKAFANPIFHDEAAARAWFEGARWPSGPVCPRCKGTKAYAIKKRSGLYRCATCRRDFSVTLDTIMERSHAKLTEWAVAFHMAASWNNEFSAYRLHRQLGCQLNTAWYIFHRVCEAMRRSGLDIAMIGDSDLPVEPDEAG